MSIIPVTRADTRSPIFAEMDEVAAQVRQRAYERYLARGGRPGHELDDWLAAEREVVGWPVAELAENSGTFQLELALAGFAAGEIAVVAGEDRIVIQALTQRYPRTQGTQVLWSEFGRRVFARQVVYPAAILPDHVQATITNGLLQVVAPKAAAADAGGQAAVGHAA